MPKINLLDRSVYELIAAGEVIEKPASVIKELAENSIDAGAKHITVEIKNGGTSYMRVADDGCGIAFEDVPTAFLRHATSKVLNADDLESIDTLGFRGEALASVAAVARVEVLTKQEDCGLGTLYRIEGSMEQAHETAGCPDGTTIIIRDLFFNTPARLKFLKKDVTEGNQVQAVIDKLALAHPDVSFRFIRDNKQVRLTSGDGDYYGVIHAVFGKQFAASLIAVDYSYNGIKISGYTSSPLFSRGNRTMQYFFINGRSIRSVLCMAALEEGYRNSIMTGKFPACVLNIEISPSEVDVNVSPSKTEARFTNEKAVFDAVHYAIKNAILNADNTRHITLGAGSAQSSARTAEPRAEAVSAVTAPAEKQASQAQKSEYITAENNSYTEKAVKDDRGTTAPAAGFTPKPEPVLSPQNNDDGLTLHLSANIAKYTPTPVERLYTQPVFIVNEEKPQESAVVPEMPEKEAIEPEMANPFRYIGRKAAQRRTVDVIRQEKPKAEIRVVGEIMKTYIVCEAGDELILIDKHAAHERIRFERLKKEFVQHSQLLAESVTVQLSADEYAAMEENADALADVGIEFLLHENMTVEVLALPTMLDEKNPVLLTEKLAKSLARNNANVSGELFDDVLHSVACKSAIKAHDTNDIAELEQLAAEVYGDERIRFCPHGRPVMISLSSREIEKFFNRIV